MNTAIKKNPKNQVKSLIFGSNGISRKEMAGESGLDVRTVSGYVEELLKQGLIIEKSAGPVGKGRPSVLYCSNSEKLAFTGIILRARELAYCSCTPAGDIISDGSESFDPESETKLKTIKRILDRIEFLKKEAESEGKINSGIGIAISRWLKPPLSVYDLFSDITEIVERETGIPTFSSTPIDAALYHIRNISRAVRDMIIIHPGIVVELGIMLGGSIPADSREIEKAFSHICVEENGAGCYCGKNGCLEHYASNVSINNILIAELKKDAISETLLFKEGLKRKIPAYVRTAEKVSLVLARGISEICRLYGLKSVNLLAVPEEISDKTVRKLEKLPQFKEKLIACSTFPQIDIARAAALMAAFEVVGNFEKI